MWPPSSGSEPGSVAPTPSDVPADDAALDAWLGALLGDAEGTALVAVGSYGRGDRAPHSDLDVVLVHRGRRDGDIHEVAQRIWYPIWDRGIGLDHSVRTVKEALAVAASDLKVALGLLDARFVAGDEELAAELADRALAQWRKKAGRFLPELGASVAERHARFGEVAFLLEPELKEGHGGTRDVHALRAAGLATAVAAGIAESESVASGHHVLHGARGALHASTGKAVDRLALQEQDRVAEAAGYADADALMAAVAEAGRAIAWASEDTWRRITSALAGPRGRRVARDRDLGRGVVLREGEVVARRAGVAGAATDSGTWLHAAAVAAEHEVPIGRETLARFAAEVPAPPDPWPAWLRNDLVALLGAGPAAIPVMETLDQYGLLTRLVPEWEAVRSKPQRNAYHRFTVDRHLCEAAARAASLTRSVHRPDLLLVGAWLHDIGKGFPGDHTEAGVVIVEKIAARMGFEDDDVAVLVAMVRHHLLLPDVATRRDLADPATAAAVADAVGDRDVLELLAALTEADSLATGPAAWSEWKATLVRELVDKAARLLAGHAPEEPVPLEHPPLPEGERLAILGEGRTCTVVAPDRPGLFCKVAGVLALHKLDVIAAQAGTARDGFAVEQFTVEPAFSDEPDWSAIAADVERALSGRLAVDARLSARARSYGGRPRTAASPAEARVLADNDASMAATVLEVRAPDGIGVLYRITRALAECELDVRAARISTLGHEVVDAFYVVDGLGRKIADAGHLAEIERAVLAELART